MSNNGDSPAYPVHLDDYRDAESHPMPGMTKREYFAARAMEGIAEHQKIGIETMKSDAAAQTLGLIYKLVARQAAGYADALLAELAKEQPA